MTKVAMLGIVGVLLALQLKSVRAEYAVYLCLGVSVLIIWQMTEQLGTILEGLRLIQESLPLDAGYIRTLVKIVGITYIAEFASDLCKDAGYQGVAGQIQIFGKLSVLAVSVPVLSALLDMIRSFLGG